MSYILDALRKSEQQRMQSAAPLLITTQVSSNVKEQPALLLYGLIATALICAGVLIGWLRPWQHVETKPVEDSVALAQAEINPPQIAPVLQPSSQYLPPEPEIVRKAEPILPVLKLKPTMKLEPKADNVERVPTKVATQVPPLHTEANEPKVIDQKVIEAAPTVEKSIAPSPEPNETNVFIEAAQEQKIIAMTALPLAIQQEIPKMSISGHTYSSISKERIVGINDRLLQEGEYLTPGLRLEQITEDGLIFSYKKYLFRHSL